MNENLNKLCQLHRTRVCAKLPVKLLPRGQPSSEVKSFVRRGGPPIRFPGNANRNRDYRHCLAHNTKNMRPGTRKKENPKNYQKTGRNPPDGAKVRIDNKISRLTIFRNVGSGRIEFLFQSRGPRAVRRGAASSAPRLFLLKNYSIIKF